MSKNGNYWNFSKSKGHNSAENYSTGPIIELSLRILVTHLCTIFQIKMLICTGDNERKMKIIGFFSKSKGFNSAENYSIGPISNSTFVFSWNIYVLNFNSKCQFCNWDNEQKMKIIGIFLNPRGITLPKLFQRPHYRTQSAYSRDTSMYHISNKNVNLYCR